MHEPLTDLGSARLGKLLLPIGQLMKCLIMEKMNLVEPKAMDPGSKCRQIESILIKHRRNVTRCISL
jgi:hypothetical protein